MVEDYFNIARENEPIFRSILRDLRDNNKKLPRIISMIVPSDLDVESKLETLFEKYSHNERTGKFTITDFTRPSKNYATITIQDVAPLSGGGASLGYIVNSDSSIEYKENLGVWLS